MGSQYLYRYELFFGTFFLHSWYYNVVGILFDLRYHRKNSSCRLFKSSWTSGCLELCLSKMRIATTHEDSLLHHDSKSKAGKPFVLFCCCKSKSETRPLTLLELSRMTTVCGCINTTQQSKARKYYESQNMSSHFPN